MMTIARCWLILTVATLTLASSLRASRAQEFATEFFLEDCELSPSGQNRWYWTLTPGDRWEYEGDEDGVGAACPGKEALLLTHLPCNVATDPGRDAECIPAGFQAFNQLVDVSTAAHTAGAGHDQVSTGNNLLRIIHTDSDDERICSLGESSDLLWAGDDALSE